MTDYRDAAIEEMLDVFEGDRPHTEWARGSMSRALDVAFLVLGASVIHWRKPEEFVGGTGMVLVMYPNGHCSNWGRQFTLPKIVVAWSEMPAPPEWATIARTADDVAPNLSLCLDTKNRCVKANRCLRNMLGCPHSVARTATDGGRVHNLLPDENPTIVGLRERIAALEARPVWTAEKEALLRFFAGRAGCGPTQNWEDARSATKSHSRRSPMFDAPVLFPCPFCGATAVGRRDVRFEISFVSCSHCGASTGVCRSELHAAAAWNRRDPTAIVPDPENDAQRSAVLASLIAFRGGLLLGGLSEKLCEELTSAVLTALKEMETK